MERVVGVRLVLSGKNKLISELNEIRDELEKLTRLFAGGLNLNLGNTDIRDIQVAINSIVNDTRRQEEIRSRADDSETRQRSTNTTQNNVGADIDEREFDLATASLRELNRELRRIVDSGDEIQSELITRIVSLTARQKEARDAIRAGVREFNSFDPTSIRAGEVELRKLRDIAKELSETELPDFEIEVEGDTVLLTDRIEELDAAVKRSNAQLGLNQRNVGNYEESVVRAFQRAGVAVDDLARERLSNLNDEQAKLRKTLEGLEQEYRKIGTEGARSSEKIEKEIRQTVTQLQRADREAQDLEKSLKRASIIDFKGITSNLLGNLGAQAVGRLTQIAGDIVRQTAQFLKDSTETFRRIEQLEKTLEAISNGSDITGLVAQARELGAVTEFSISQVLQLDIELKKLGFSPDFIEGVVPALTDFATVARDSNGEALKLGDAAEVVGGAINSLGLDVDKTNGFIDQLTSSFSRSGLNAIKFRNANRVVGPAVRALNIETGTYLATLGKLVDSSIRAESAGTGLRRILGEMGNESSRLSARLGFTVKSGDDLVAAFRELRDGGLGLTEAIELVDKEFATQLLILAENADEIGELSQSYETLGNVAGLAARTIRNSLDSDIREANSALEALRRTIGEKLTPALRSFLDVLTDVANGIRRAFSSDTVNLEEDISRITNQVKLNETSLVPLVERYDELRAKITTLGSSTRLSASEQQELREVTQGIISILPQAADGFDAVGKAISINRQEVSRLVSTYENLEISQATSLSAQLEKENEELLRSFNKIERDLERGFSEQATSAGIGGASVIKNFFDAEETEQNISQLQEVGENIERNRKRLLELDIIIRKLPPPVPPADKLFPGVEIEEDEEAIRTLGARISELKNQIDELNSTRENLGEFDITGRAELDAQLSNLERELAALERKPFKKSLKIDTKPAEGSIEALNAAISKLEKERNQINPFSDRFEDITLVEIPKLQRQLEDIAEIQSKIDFELGRVEVKAQIDEINDEIKSLEAIDLLFGVQGFDTSIIRNIIGDLKNELEEIGEFNPDENALFVRLKFSATGQLDGLDDLIPDNIAETPESELELAGIDSNTFKESLERLKDENTAILTQINNDSADIISATGEQSLAIELSIQRRRIEAQIDFLEQKLKLEQAFGQDTLATEKAISEQLLKLEQFKVKAVEQLNNDTTTTNKSLFEFLGIDIDPEDEKKLIGAIKRTAKIAEDIIANIADLDRIRLEEQLENQIESISERERQRLVGVREGSEEEARVREFYDKQREAAEKAAAEERKDLAIKETLIQAAAAAVKTFAQFGFPIGLVPVAALAALTATQISLIRQQEFGEGDVIDDAIKGYLAIAGTGKPSTTPSTSGFSFVDTNSPQYAKSFYGKPSAGKNNFAKPEDGEIPENGIIKGPSHRSGQGVKTFYKGVPIELEGGEYKMDIGDGTTAIINKRSASVYKTDLDRIAVTPMAPAHKRALLSQINSANGWGKAFQEGGVLGSSNVSLTVEPLNAPVPVSQIEGTINNDGGSSEAMELAVAAINLADEVSKRIDRIVVVNDPAETVELGDKIIKTRNTRGL